MSEVIQTFSDVKSDFKPVQNDDKKFPILFWNYHYVGDYGIEEVKKWADCGMSVGMGPRLKYNKASEADKDELVRFLDEAEKQGIKLVLSIRELENSSLLELGHDEYRKLVTEVYNRFKHPALYGFFVGDEPSTAEDFQASWDAVKIQKEVAPELRPYLNLHTCMDDTDPALLGGKTFREWLKAFAEDTGFDAFSYGHYDQVWNEDGIDSYYRNIKALREAADGAGVDMWNTQLSSAHYMFRICSEYDFSWQVNTAAACGSRGIVWFRLYDREIGKNEHGSPLDEYGNKTETYLPMLHANRRFHDHYGELFMKLHYKSTYFNHKSYGGFETMGVGTHPIITYVRSTAPALISFFEDDEGNEYLVLVNNSMTEPGVFRPEFDREKYKLEEVFFNGQMMVEYDLGKSEAHWDGLWLHPGQMEVYKIIKR